MATGSDPLHTRLPGLLALLLLLLIYGLTLQQDVNGSSHDYTLDTGEIQVALNVWGTVHYTGYPHYTIAGALLTRAGRALGLSPAAAASASSLPWTLLGLLLVYRLLLRLLPDDPPLAALAVVTLGLVETIWLHSVIAEVYSFSFFLVALALWLADRLRARWHAPTWLAATAVLGTAFAHHRVLIFLTGVVGLLVGPPLLAWLRDRPLRLLPTLLAFVAPWLAYLYLPLRAWQSSAWVYGRPQTWAGFWQQVTGSEVTGMLLRLPADVETAAANARFLGGHLDAQLPWPIVLLGLAGLLWLARDRGLVGAAALLGTAAFTGFIFLFPRAVWAPAVLMPPVMWLVIGLAYLLGQLGQRRRPLRPAGWLALILLSAALARANLPLVRALTVDPAGRELIAQLARVPAAAPGQPAPTVALPWGAGYFAAAYGRLVTGELAHLTLVDHRANFRDILARPGALVTPALYLHYWPPAWWEALSGKQLAFNAVTADLVAIGRPGAETAVEPSVDFEIGNGVRIRAAAVEQRDGRIDVALLWQAEQPLPRDYSVAVHLLARLPVTGPQDLLSQADAVHPVRGWYPTSRWAPGEIVRDAYSLPVPPGSRPAALRLTQYYQDDAGQFVNGAWFIIPLP